MQRQRRAVRARVLAVRVELAGEGLAALGDSLGQVALHQAEPVAVDVDLVFGVDRGDRVLAVHDGGQRGFDQHVLDAGGIGGADAVGAVDLDLEMQAVVLEQDGRGRVGVALVAGELGRRLERGGAVRQRDLQLAVLDLSLMHILPPGPPNGASTGRISDPRPVTLRKAACSLAPRCLLYTSRCV